MPAAKMGSRANQYRGCSMLVRLSATLHIIRNKSNHTILLMLNRGHSKHSSFLACLCAVPLPIRAHLFSDSNMSCCCCCCIHRIWVKMD